MRVLPSLPHRLSNVSIAFRGRGEMRMLWQFVTTKNVATNRSSLIIKKNALCEIRIAQFLLKKTWSRSTSSLIFLRCRTPTLRLGPLLSVVLQQVLAAHFSLESTWAPSKRRCRPCLRQILQCNLFGIVMRRHYLDSIPFTLCVFVFLKRYFFL